MSETKSPNNAGRRGTRRLLIAASLLSVLVILVLLCSGVFEQAGPSRARRDLPLEVPAEDASTPAVPDEHVSPFLNTRPHVAYIDDSRCDACHAEIAQRYRQHPMGQSMTVLTADAIEAEANRAPATPEPLRLGDFDYEVRYENGVARHIEHYLDRDRDAALTITKPITYAVGAGSRGRSYIVQEGDQLWMSPLTYYPAHQRWALSPGYERNHSHFYRPVIGACLFCHSGKANWNADTRNTYREPALPQPSIGCQRCHGPGAMHVAIHENPQDSSTTELKEPFDKSIVNPAHLSDERTLDVCTQCHLSGSARVIAREKQWDDFRPGLPLSDFIAIYVEKESTGHHFVGHVEQMQESRCYVATSGKLRCTSCHDPHGVPNEEEKILFYQQKCLNCHGTGQTGCSETQSARDAQQDACANCHMPALATEITHAAVTDHRVLKRPETETSEMSRRGPAASGARRLVPFDRAALTRPGYPIQRNLGLALLMASENDSTVDLTRDTTTAAALLEQAVQQMPADFAAREGLATAYERLNRWADALAQFQIVLETHPEREFSLSGSSRQLMQLNRYAEAALYWQKVSELNPGLPVYQAEWGLALAKLQRWEECEPLCREAVARFPDSFACRQLWVESLLALDRKAEAEAMFSELLRLQPQSSKPLQRWFDEHPLRK